MPFTSAGREAVERAGRPALRSDVPMPARIARLPVAENGYPVPWFVADPTDFRVIDPERVPQAIAMHRCWICGEVMGSHRAWVFGPLCSLQRVTLEPPCHRDCAEYAMKVCPYLASPRFKRSKRPNKVESKNYDAMPFDESNHGMHCIWMTKSPDHIRSIDVERRLLFVGKPVSVTWYTQGRLATSDEVTVEMARARERLAAFGSNAA